MPRFVTSPFRQLTSLVKVRLGILYIILLDLNAEGGAVAIYVK